MVANVWHFGSIPKDKLSIIVDRLWYAFLFSVLHSIQKKWNKLQNLYYYTPLLYGYLVGRRRMQLLFILWIPNCNDLQSIKERKITSPLFHYCCCLYINHMLSTDYNLLNIANNAKSIIRLQLQSSKMPTTTVEIFSTRNLFVFCNAIKIRGDKKC